VDRRNFLKLAGAGAASIVVSGCSLSASRSSRRTVMTKPNIVFILADDLGWHQLGCYGSNFYETPNLDNLAKQGIRFTDAYAAAPVCSPTRASIMTGKYPARLHLTDFIKGASPKDRKLLTPEWTPYLPLEQVTIAEVLKSAGYVTGHFGKWHLNKDKNYKPGRPGDPGSQGFDEVLTTRKPSKSPKGIYEQDWHHVRQITEAATAFIERHRDRPFFCYVPHNSIHRPEIEKDELVQKYRNKPGADNDVKYGHNNPVQAAMLETLDKSVGTILKKLDELGLADNTLVIFFSDNGHLGPKDSRPLRGSKGDLYEGGIRVPLIIRWPSVVKPGRVCRQPVISNDFFATLCEAAGRSGAASATDGVSLVPLLEGTGSLRRDALYWHYPHYHHQSLGPCGAVRRGKYKLIEWFEKSIDDREDALELYDLEKDIGERNNLAGRMPQLTQQLYSRLRQWRKSVGAQEMKRNPGYASQT